MQHATSSRGRNQNPSLAPGRGTKGKGRALKVKQHQVFCQNGDDDDPAVVSEIQQQWLLSALTSLQHPQPSIHGVSETFPQLIEWLEDRCIRLWDIPRRDAILRLERDNNYYTLHLPVYLQALDCPPSYYNSPNWQNVPAQRYRVLHWVVSCALQEVLQDHQQQQHQQQQQPTTKIPQSISPDAFPLGFSTGDEEVDQVLTVLRMQLVAAMGEQQQKVNAAIQQATSTEQPKLKASFQRRRNQGK